MEDRNKLMDWFRDQKDYWIGCITSHNNPMYVPMVMGLTKSGKDMGVQVMDQPLAKGGKPTVEIMVKHFEKEGDELVAAIYYFHVDLRPAEGEIEEVKQTLLTFNMFIPSVEGVYAGKSFIVTCERGNGGMETDKVTVEVMKDDVGEIPHLKPLWQNPFF